MTAKKVITIDGPSAVGKGTMAKKLATALGFACLDSGALYRIVALQTVNEQIDPDDEKAVAEAMDGLKLTYKDNRLLVNNEDVGEAIREEAISQMASKVAVHPLVRKKLLALMQNFPCQSGLVADGRDMGTVVFPNADIKVFLTASAEVRAERRYKQLSANAKNVTLDAVFSELIARDARDTTRSEAPLLPAKDAVVIDTSCYTPAQVFEQIMQAVQKGGILPIH